MMTRVRMTLRFVDGPKAGEEVVIQEAAPPPRWVFAERIIDRNPERVFDEEEALEWFRNYWELVYELWKQSDYGEDLYLYRVKYREAANQR